MWVFMVSLLCVVVTIAYMTTYTKEQYESAHSWGIDAGIDLHGCNPDTIRDAEKIKEFVAELCERIGVRRFGECQVVHFADHNKDVAGFSMVQLIETSLVSAHFANKTNATYLDVFSCKYFDPEVAANYAKEFFEADDYVLQTRLRK